MKIRDVADDRRLRGFSPGYGADHGSAKYSSAQESVHHAADLWTCDAQVIRRQVRSISTTLLRGAVLRMRGHRSPQRAISVIHVEDSK